MTETQPLTVVFALFPGVTQLDFTGPHQVLSRLPGARLIIASARGGDLLSDDGLRFTTERLEDVSECAVLCIPGGTACVEAIKDEVFMAQVRRLARGARYVTSVCTGSIVLGAAGLSDGQVRIVGPKPLPQSLRLVAADISRTERMTTNVWPAQRLWID